MSGDGGTSGSAPRPTVNPLPEAITGLVNLMLLSEVSQFVRGATLFGGSITAIAKKGEGGQANHSRLHLAPAGG